MISSCRQKKSAQENMGTTYMIGLLSLMSTGTATLRGEDAPQYDAEVFTEELLAVIETEVGEVESFGELGELSLIVFSFACRLHLYRWFCSQQQVTLSEWHKNKDYHKSHT